MNREPETYDELILQKKCIELTKYYNLTMEQLEEIYDFLKNNENGNLQGKMTYILLNVGTSAKKTISAPCISQNIDEVIVNRKQFTVIPHYEPSSHSYSSGGSSSNNNNNNNNNNNR